MPAVSRSNWATPLCRFHIHLWHAFHFFQNCRVPEEVSPLLHAINILYFYLLIKTFSARTLHGCETFRHLISQEVSIFSKIRSPTCRIPTCGIPRLMTLLRLVEFPVSLQLLDGFLAQKTSWFSMDFLHNKRTDFQRISSIENELIFVGFLAQKMC